MKAIVVFFILIHQITNFKVILAVENTVFSLNCSFLIVLKKYKKHIFYFMKMDPLSPFEILTTLHYSYYLYALYKHVFVLLLCWCILLKS